MSGPHVIALYSPAPRSGKSTVANELEQQMGYEIVSFAYPLKRMLEAFFEEAGFSPNEVDAIVHGDRKDYPLDMPGDYQTTYRHCAQTLGTEWGREYIDPDVWVEIAMRKIKRGHRGIVVDDMRMPNEYAALKRVGARMVYIVRPGASPPNGHSSEGSLSGFKWDAIIANDYGVDELKAAARALTKI